MQLFATSCPFHEVMGYGKLVLFLWKINYGLFPFIICTASSIIPDHGAGGMIETMLSGSDKFMLFLVHAITKVFKMP